MAIKIYKKLIEWEAETVKMGLKITLCACTELCKEPKICEHLVAKLPGGEPKGMYKLHLGYGFLEEE